MSLPDESPATPKWVFKATETFWSNFYALPSDQKEWARVCWERFKANPFDPSLRPHKINSLSTKAKRTVYAIEIEGDLRAIFWIDGTTVQTLDIGTHAIYKGGIPVV